MLRQGVRRYTCLLLWGNYLNSGFQCFLGIGHRILKNFKYISANLKIHLKNKPQLSNLSRSNGQC